MKDRALEIKDAGDPRLYCFYHKIEEVAELAIAMANQDEVEVADALGDLIYLALGDAVTFNIPMKEVFDEVHKSNMSKTRKLGDSRMKDRSPESGFKPPLIAEAIKKGRSKCSDPSTT
jgi:predicted HAD superfamily Cof-like phosphohydrolase